MRELNGWHRIGIAASVIWIIFASCLYFSELGVVIDIFDRGRWTYWANPGGALRLYSFEGDTLVGKFRLVGFVIITLAPVVVLWGSGYTVAWITREFSGSKK